jgi:cytochrome b561
MPSPTTNIPLVRAASIRPDAGHYGPVAIGFHWLMALLIVVVGVLGLLHDSWPRATQTFWINIHALVGLTVLAVVIARLWWRSTHRPPELPPEVGALSRQVSPPVHGLLYALMIVIPLLGIVTFVWHGRVFDFGLFKIDPGIKSTRAIFHPTEDIHGYLAYGLFALAGLHILAALWHHFVRKDGVLMRIWPRR